MSDVSREFSEWFKEQAGFSWDEWVHQQGAAGPVSASEAWEAAAACYEQKLARVARERDAAREHVQRYGRHDYGCPRDRYSGGKCDCGFADACTEALGLNDAALRGGGDGVE